MLISADHFVRSNSNMYLGANRQCYVRFVVCKQNSPMRIVYVLHVNRYCNILFRIIVPFPGVFLDGIRNTNWFCVEYTVRDLGHVLIESEPANNIVFDHEPWKLRDSFSADHSKLMFTSTLPVCESEIADSDAGGHALRKGAYSEPKQNVFWVNKVVAIIATLRL